MSNWHLTAAVIGWLRYDQHCPLVCWERSPLHTVGMYRPDIVGVTRDRRVIEVELKQSVADFRANRLKRGIEWRQKGWASEYPLRFYFGVPRELVDKVKPLLVDGEGLLTLAEHTDRFGHHVEVIVGAKHDKRATRLSPLQVWRMVIHQTGTLHRAVKALAEKEP